MTAPDVRAFNPRWNTGRLIYTAHVDGRRVGVVYQVLKTGLWFAAARTDFTCPPFNDDGVVDSDTALEILETNNDNKTPAKETNA